MGAGAMASYSCFTWLSSSTPPTLSQEHAVVGSEMDKELHAVFEIDVALPEPFNALSYKEKVATNTELATTGHLIVFTRTCRGRSEQKLHDLPLRLLKSLLLEFLLKRNERIQQQSPDSIDIELSALRPHPSLELYITSLMTSQRVRVIFDTSKRATERESELSLVLQLCGRCGEAAGCACGWRQRHVIWPQREQQSVLEFITSNLTQLSPIKIQAVRCYRLRLGGLNRGRATNFGAQIYRHDIQRPSIESPYVVFKMEIYLGDLTWRIARRYREFAELHFRLKMAVEECILPQLPPTTWLSVTEPSFLLQRQRLLENYLKGVLMVDELQASVPLLVFLGVLSTSYVDHVALRTHRRQILHLQVLEFFTRPGDLILFNGRANVSVLQRSMTRSEWDHVAIVVPSREGGHLQLLEATGDGVTLSPLVARLLAYSTFHVRYLSLRKLSTPLLSRSVVNDLLERFTTEVEGLPYGLSIRELLHARQPDPRSQDRTFFCSQLVAEAYKALGIISSSSDSMDFWPGSFSLGDLVDTELARHGASLSPEVIIDCKLLEVATAIKRNLIN